MRINGWYVADANHSVPQEAADGKLAYWVVPLREIDKTLVVDFLGNQGAADLYELEKERLSPLLTIFMLLHRELGGEAVTITDEPEHGIEAGEESRATPDPTVFQSRVHDSKDAGRKFFPKVIAELDKLTRIFR